jgi:hypothetical protein
MDAWIVPNCTRELLSRIADSTCRCFAVIDSDASPLSPASDIRFARHSSVPHVLHARQIAAPDSASRRPLPSWISSVTPLAWSQELPLWAIAATGGVRHHYASVPIPSLENDRSAYECFEGAHLPDQLPLLAFLRSVAEQDGWEAPPLHACFMFDDPNLHWPTYGYLDYAALVKHAASHRYHASFATIPLDGWFDNTVVVRLFQAHPEYISLLMHGNDHVRDELARVVSTRNRARTLQQALCRIEAMERRTNLQVARVMAPPHGACAEDALEQMAMLGYEAACVSRGSLRHFNPGANWLPAFGLAPCDLIGGSPVLPRFRLSKSCHNAILLAAVLRQPIIPVGHHQDVRDGMDLLARLAQYVNDLGEVRWTNLTDIARHQYLRRIEGNVLSIKAYTKRIEVAIPASVTRLSIARPWLESEAEEPLQLHVPGRQTQTIFDTEEPFLVPSGTNVTVFSGDRLPRADCGTTPGRKLWPLARRFMTEARDRVAPTLHLRGRP